MATYDKPIFTNQSNKLVSAVAANSEQLTFTKIVYSSDDFSNKTDDDIANLTDLNNKEIVATAQSFPENGITKVRGAGNNDNLDQGLNIKTFGLYAKGNSIPEMLVAVATSQNADYLDVHNNNASNQLTYTFNLKISNTKNINFSNIHDVSVTQSDLQSAIANIDLSAYAKKEDLNELNKTINQKISGPNSTVSQNINTMGTKANQYTDEQLKGYTNTADLNAELGGKQPLGNYASPDDVNNAKKDAISHSDSNKDNLQEQINSKQPTGDYVTNEDLNPKLNQKQDAGSYLTTDEFNKYGLSINGGKIMYNNSPIIVANRPSNVQISITSTANSVSYNITCKNGGINIDSYTVFYKNINDSNWINLNTKDESGTINNLVEGQKYQFKAIASNVAGDSKESNIVETLVFDKTNLDHFFSISNDANAINAGFIKMNLNLLNWNDLPYISEAKSLKVYLGQVESYGRPSFSFNNLKNAPVGKPYSDQFNYLYILETRIIPFPNTNIIPIFVSNQWGNGYKNFWGLFGAEALDANGNSLGYHTSVTTG